jgi:hypothetical protein
MGQQGEKEKKITITHTAFYYNPNKRQNTEPTKYIYKKNPPPLQNTTLSEHILHH